MSVVVAILLCSWAPCLILWAIVIPALREADEQRQADDAGQAAPADVRKPAPEQHMHTAACEQLLAGDPAGVAIAPLWQPRVSARRVTQANRIRWAYAQRDYPVPGYSWALGTTAQEVTP
jgi:hypothetical protein